MQSVPEPGGGSDSRRPEKKEDRWYKITTVVPTTYLFVQVSRLVRWIGGEHVSLIQAHPDPTGMTTPQRLDDVGRTMSRAWWRFCAAPRRWEGQARVGLS